ncbi:M16 family metallopeptidase [Candidatus Neomarinimicrobiota bacterium]
MPTTSKKISLVLLLLAVWLNGQSGLTAQRLNNGLEVYHMPFKGSEFVSLTLIFDAGPSHQTPGQNGISRLAANFINTSPIAATGAFVETHLRSEGYSLLVTSAADSIGPVIRTLAAVFDGVQANNIEFLDVQNRASRWIERTYDSNTFRAQRGLLQALWGDQWQRKDPIGDSPLVSSIGLGEVVDWNSLYIVPRNCALIIVGDLDDDQLTEYVESSLEALPSGENHITTDEGVTFPYLINDVDTLVVTDPVSPMITLAWQGPGFGQDQAGTYAARVFVELLNNESGVFQQNVRATRNFVRVKAEFEPSKYLSTIILRCYPDPGYGAETAEVIEQILDDYTSSGNYSRAQIIDARKRARIAHTSLTQSPTLLVRALAEAWARGELDTFDQFEAAIAGVNRTEIERFAANYIVGQPRVGAYAMKAKDFQPLRKYEYEGEN